MQDEDDQVVLQSSVLPSALDLLSLGLGQVRAAGARTSETSQRLQVQKTKARLGAVQHGAVRPKGPGNKSLSSASGQASAGVLGQGLLGVLRLKLQALRYIAPGSYAEAEAAARLVFLFPKVQKARGKTDGDTGHDHDLAECVRVHVARYGQVSAEVLLRMLQAHTQNKLADALADALVAGKGSRGL